MQFIILLIIACAIALAISNGQRTEVTANVESVTDAANAAQSGCSYALALVLLAVAAVLVLPLLLPGA